MDTSLGHPESLVINELWGGAIVYSVRARVYGVRAPSFVILESALSPYFGQGLRLRLGLDNRIVKDL